MDTFFYLWFAASLTIAATEVTVTLDPFSKQHVVSEGDGIALNCVAKGWTAPKPPQLQWISNKRQPITSTSSNSRVFVNGRGKSLRLVIRKVNISDSGQWECRLQLPGGPKSFKIQIDTWQEIKFVNLKKLQEPKIGTNALIKCEIISRPTAVVGWTYNGNEIKSSDRFTQVTDGLKIKKITEADNGIYTCSAEIKSKFDFKAEDIVVRVAIPPEIQNPPGSHDDGVKGKDIKIQCVASGKPPPTYTWFRDVSDVRKVEITNQPGSRFSVNKEKGLLEIKKLEVTDKGDYTCRASNTGGRHESSYHLDVKVPPKIIEVHSGKGSEQGEASITCIAEGNELPEIMWKKVGEPAAVTEKKSNNRIKLLRTPDTNNKRVTLKMTIISLRASDTSKYTCIAQNTYGKATKNATLDVQFTPKFSKDTPTITYTWADSPKSRSMTCKAEGNPTPLVKWERNKQELKSNGTYVITNVVDSDKHTVSSSLKVVVDFANKNQFGDYVCVAENMLGTTTHTVTLREAKKPKQPTYVDIIEDTPTSVKLVISPPINDGGMPVLRYHISFTDKEKKRQQFVNINLEHRREDEKKPTTVADVLKLSPSKQYVFDVSAVNAVGRGDPLSKSHMTKDISRPSKIRITSGKSGVDSEKYTLTWDTPPTGGLPLLRYEVKYRRVKLNETTDRIIETIGEYMTKTVVKDKNSVELGEMLPNRTYQIGITAVNQLGNSPIANINIRTGHGKSDREVKGPHNEGCVTVATGIVTVMGVAGTAIVRLYLAP